MYNEDPPDVIFIDENPPNKGMGAVPEEWNLFAMAPREKKRLATIWCGWLGGRAYGGSVASCGYTLVTALINAGLKPSLFGFSSPVTEGWGHYFENRPNPGNSHAREFEKLGLAWLHNQGLLKMYSPEVSGYIDIGGWELASADEWIVGEEGVLGFPDKE